MRKSSDKNIGTAILSFRLVCINFLIQICVLILLCIVALITDIGTDSIYLFTVIGLCAGNMASGFINGRTVRRKGLINGIIYTLPSTGIVLLISLYMNDFKIGYKLPLSAALLCIFAAVGGILAVNIRKKIKVKR